MRSSSIVVIAAVLVLVPAAYASSSDPGVAKADHYCSTYDRTDNSYLAKASAYLDKGQLGKGADELSTELRLVSSQLQILRAVKVSPSDQRLFEAYLSDTMRLIAIDKELVAAVRTNHLQQISKISAQSKTVKKARQLVAAKIGFHACGMH